MIERLRELREHLRRQKEDPASSLQFEAQLARQNLLGALEESGDLPIVHNPNPYDPVTQTRDHDRWWRKHPEEAQAFRNSVENRQQALRNIQAGSKLPKGFSGR